MSAADLLLGPLQFEFMQRSLIAVVLVGILAGILGVFVVLRGTAFISDALAHTTFPGVVIAYLLHSSIFLFAILFGLLTAIGIALVGHGRRIGENTAIGILLAASFALGVTLISSRHSYTTDLTSFLFGNVLGVTWSDLAITLVIGVPVLVIIFLLYKELVLVSFDPTSAEAIGLPVAWLETLLLVLLALTIVVALETVGNVLVVGLLITPAATARMLTDRLGRMMLLGAVLGATSGIAGLYTSFYVNLAAGATIVMIASVLFLLALLFAPHHGLLVRWVHGR